MSFIGKNIKKIRTIKKISQADFAKKFNLARPSVGAYEEGRSEPKIDTIIQISKTYNLSIDLLLTRELSLNDLFHFDTIHKKLAVSDNSERALRSEIICVSDHEQINYVLNHTKTDYVNQLPKIAMPSSLLHSKRVFEISGSDNYLNQLGIHSGDWLFARLSTFLQLPETGAIIVGITSHDLILGKLREKESNQIRIFAVKPKMEEIRVQKEDLSELWVVSHKISGILENEKDQLERRLVLIENRLESLEKKNH
jgi:transcriptional regulator with XRE-family HTH domain